MGGGTTQPSGTVTFLFTDIEGSTRLLQDLGDRYEAALSEHREILRRAITANDGHEVGTEGDSFFVAFARASDGVATALHAQLGLASHDWSHRPVTVRMGVHTGEAQIVDESYVGLAVHQAARISSAAHGGQVLVSQTTKDLAAGSLPNGASLVDLGEHRLKDLAQPTRLYNLAHSGLRAELPPPRTLSVLPNNLPLQLTSFVGRDDEIAKVSKLLETARLVTLSGAGGSGKTRLALQIAADMVTEYRDGVWLADLSTITDPDLIMRGVAEALGVREEKDRSIEDVLIEHLQGKDLLVVVDNCEHMAEESASVVDRLLHAASGLRIIATSRETLGAEGESVFRVPSLDTPKADEPPEALAAYEAVRLFCDRASQATGDFGLTNDNARSVTEICRRLDGMPLAIELAAARVRMLTPQEIAKRLDDRFKLLTGGVRTGIRRQQTLRAAVDWSYEMLSDSERLLFRRLSVFVGGFTLEAAEGVCSEDGIDSYEVMDLLGNLVDRSLVVAEPHAGTTRYRLLETMREYGREALASSGEAPDVWGRHLHWFTMMAADAMTGLEGSDEPMWLRRLDTELDNVRQALSWATTGGDPCLGVDLAVSLYKYWRVRWYITEAERWMRSALEGCTDASPDGRARGLFGVAMMTAQSGRMNEARALYHEVAGMPRTPDTSRWVAEAINDLGLIAAYMDSDIERAIALLEEALEIRREIGHDSGVSETLNNIGVIAHWTGDHERARALFEEALEIRRRLGARSELAFMLSQLAGVRQREGDYDAAGSLEEEALAIRREIEDRPGMANSLQALGAIARLRGDFDHALALYEEAEELCRDRGDEYGAQASKRGRGHIALELGRYEEARELYEDALKSAREIGSPVFTAFSLNDVGNLERAVGNLDEAKRNYNDVLEALLASQDRNNPPIILSRLSWVALAQDDVAEARTKADEALRMTEGAVDPWTRALALEAAALADAAEEKTESAATRRKDALIVRVQAGLRPTIASSLEACGVVAAAEGRGELAAKLLGAAEELRTTVGTVIHPAEASEHEEAVAKAREALDRAAFDAAWSKGRAMPLDEAVELALQA